MDKMENIRLYEKQRRCVIFSSLADRLRHLTFEGLGRESGDSYIKDTQSGTIAPALPRKFINNIFYISVFQLTTPPKHCEHVVLAASSTTWPTTTTTAAP